MAQADSSKAASQIVHVKNFLIERNPERVANTTSASEPASAEPTLATKDEENNLDPCLVDVANVTAIFRRYQAHSDKIAKPSRLESNIKALLALGDVSFYQRVA